MKPNGVSIPSNWRVMNEEGTRPGAFSLKRVLARKEWFLWYKPPCPPTETLLKQSRLDSTDSLGI